jgi:hypothetical protein
LPLRNHAVLWISLQKSTVGLFSDGIDVLSQFATVWVAENGNGRDVEVD